MIESNTKNKYSGNYLSAFLNDDLINLNSLENNYYSKKFNVKEDETIYIYSFKESKLLFAEGFNKMYGVKDEELTINKLNSLFTPHFKSFFDEYHDRVLLYLYNNNSHLETFSMKTIIKVNTFESPVLLETKVFQTDENGNLVSVIGKSKKMPNLKTTDIVQYSFEGKAEKKFKNKINHNLNFKKCISLKESELIEESKEKKRFEFDSIKLDMSSEEVKSCFNNLINRFDLNSKNELIKFAENNYLIPSQFKVLS